MYRYLRHSQTLHYLRTQDSAGLNLLCMNPYPLRIKDHVYSDKEREFNRALEATDSDFQNKLRFKCVGPLPPYSFATVTIKRFDPEEIRRSAKILGLNGKAELTFVKKVYKELSRQCHPDMDPNLSVQKFEELNRAYELIFDYCKDKPRFLSREAVEGSVRLESAIPQGGLSDAA